jgi:GNAT superfamily N-acetyltransferase
MFSFCVVVCMIGLERARGFKLRAPRVNFLKSTSFHVANIARGDTADKTFAFETCNLLDLGALMRLANLEFAPQCGNQKDVISLNLEMLRLFVPKLLLPMVMDHTVIGVKSMEGNRKELVGFVDLSLQSNAGTLDALIPRTLKERQQRYGAKNLEPYLCNLLITDKYRKLGLGRKLVSSCEELAKKWGHSTINLHVETKSLPALSLYFKCGFQPVTTVNGILFMRKKLLSQYLTK